MKIYGTHKARRTFGKLLREAHRDEVPFTLRLNHDVACVGAPFSWFKRACRTLKEPPHTTAGPTGFDAQRLALGALMTRVLEDGAFIVISRAGGTACVLVPTGWYEQMVDQVGPPLGDVPEGVPKEPEPGAGT